MKLLSYINASYVDNPVPGQNEWIESLHRVGIMDHKMFFQVVILSTLGMMSGLSLGPEMPLVLAAGMVGSKIALMTKQSVLSARVINLTACSAAIGGFFGFPMAGALFVLELPHRMGLQYFEALSPAVISSIISVIVNRIGKFYRS
jgi:H+/Cl- antiporter ClcA